jgi:hypothetical protein
MSSSASGPPTPEGLIEATDDRGRRWYHLRPKPRRRADLMGFNSTLWMVVVWLLSSSWPSRRSHGGDMSTVKTSYAAS